MIAGSFIHSFKNFYSASSSPLLLRGAQELLQESNLTTRQPRRAPHHVIHLILQKMPPSEWRITENYWEAELVTFMGRELYLPKLMHQMFPTTLRAPAVHLKVHFPELHIWNIFLLSVS